MVRAALIWLLLTTCAIAGPREDVLAVAERLVGTVEETGRNDGPLIEQMLQWVGAGKGDPWCAAYNYGCYKMAGYGDLVPASAWSPDWVKNATWIHNGGQTPQAADSFGIYFQSKRRVAHTGLIKSWGRTVRTFEGNTIPDGAVGDQREGGGAYSKRRSPRQIYAARNWFNKS